MKKIFFIFFAFSLIGLIYFIYNFPKKNLSSQHKAPASLLLASLSNITIQSDRSSYSSDEVIKITLANQSKDSIYSSDHQSNCTVVILQRQIEKNWQEENQCALFRQPILFSIDSNKNTVLELSPLPTGWVKGIYRAAMVVHLQNNKNHSYTILSQVFHVK